MHLRRSDFGNIVFCGKIPKGINIEKLFNEDGIKNKKIKKTIVYAIREGFDEGKQKRRCFEILSYEKQITCKYRKMRELLLGQQNDNLYGNEKFYVILTYYKDFDAKDSERILIEVYSKTNMSNRRTRHIVRSVRTVRG